MSSKEADFVVKITALFKRLANIYSVSFKERKTTAGKTYLMTAQIPGFTRDIFIRFDFSMRDDSVSLVSAIVDNKGYPIIITNFIWTLGKDEIFAEKVKAAIKRNKYRDLYDLWILLQLGTSINIKLINKKMEYYGETFDKAFFLQKLGPADKKQFVQELRPFVPAYQREELEGLFEYILQYLKDKIK